MEITAGGFTMSEVLQKISLTKDKSEMFRQFKKGNRYQIVLDTGESVIIAVLAQGKIEEAYDDMSDEEFAKASQYSAFRDEEDDVAPEYRHLLKKIEL